ncbi:predicted protein [Thalassiosira pseudonana CCMP1335]|uniref:Uncharacterized protein n=1 Tax=Thalassiosira pseudonana TaxID=35128 RepID=B8BXV1_THAPS|nr:predicted protein [Thalassiosira pseudonana CCMP1335]EED94271.1 predicted protein [Thalassiosira pseudonana CCMP1335]
MMMTTNCVNDSSRTALRRPPTASRQLLTDRAQRTPMGAKNSKPKPSSNKGGTITPTDRAILDLKNSRDRLTKYRTKLDLDTTKLGVRAKTLHAEGNTPYALKLLKLRKYKTQEADRVEEQLLTVLRMVDKISEKQNEQDVVVAMKRGKEALQILHNEMGIDDVLDLMDEIRDQDEVEKRINELLGEEGIRVVEDMGDEDILLELEQLEEDVRLETEAATAKIQKEDNVVLPAAPSKPLPAVENPTIGGGRKQKVAVAS